MDRVILLNYDYNFLGVIDWKRAVSLVVQQKAEIIKATDKILRSAGKTFEMYLPKILRLAYLARSVYKSKVPYSKKNVIFRDRYICQYCGDKTKGNMTIDHVIPKSKGGKSTFENCVACCKKCNSIKDDKLPSRCGMSLKRRPFRPTIMEFISIKMRILGIDKLLEDLWKNKQ